MTVLLCDEIYRLLNINQHQTIERTAKETTLKSLGPVGQYDPWLSIMEGDENCWHMPETARQPARKKLILSNAVLANRALDEVDYSLIQAMIEHCDVYLWPGDSTPLRNCQPISNMEEFFCQRERLQVATESKCHTSLAHQGLSTDEYECVDFFKYETIKNHFKTGQRIVNSELSIDDTGLLSDMDLERLIESIDFTNLEGFFIKPSLLPNQARRKLASMVLRKAPHLNGTTSLYFTKDFSVTKEYCSYPGLYFRDVKIEQKQVLEKLDYSSEIEETDSFDCEHLNKMRQLSFFGIALLNNVDLSAAISLQELNLDLYKNPFSLCEIKNFLHKHRNLSIKKLDLTIEKLEESKERLLDVSSFIHMEEFSYQRPTMSDEMADNQIKKLRFSPQQKIHKLNIVTYDQLPELDESELPHLKSLSIKMNSPYNGPIEKLNVGRFQHLQKLQLTGCSKVSIQHLAKLTYLELESCNSILFTPSPTLKCLKLRNCSLENLDLSLFPNLEELEIEDPTRLDRLDFSQCPNLKRLKLKGVSVNSDIFLLSQLHTLSLSNIPINSSREFLHEGNFIFPHLRNLELESFYMGEVSLAGCRQLESLSCKKMFIGNLYGAALQKLKSVHFDEAACGRLILSGSSLRDLTIRSDHELSIYDPLRIFINNCEQLHRLHIKARKPVTISGLNSCASLQDAVFTCPSRSLPQLVSDLPLSCQQFRTKPFEAKSSKGEAVAEKENKQEVTSKVPSAPQPEATEKDDKHIAAAAPSPLEAILAERDRRLLHQANESNPVASFGFSRTLKVDNNTSDEKVYKASPGFKIVLEEQGYVDRGNHRIQIFDEVKEEKGKIIFSTSLNKMDWVEVPFKKNEFDEEKVKELREKAHQSKDKGVGIVSGSFVYGEYYPLPMTGPASYLPPPELYVPSCDIRLFYHVDQQQFYVQFRAKKEEKAPVVEAQIVYQYNRNLKYNTPPPKGVDPVMLPALRETALSKKFITRLRNHPEFKSELKNIIESKKPLHERIKDAAAYFRGFDEKPLAVPVKAADELDMQVINIVKKNGICRHRAQGFMLFVRSVFGVPARIVLIEDHLYAEVRFQNGEIRRYDLGGRASKDETPLAQRENLLETISAAAKKEEKKTVPDAEVVKAEEQYYQDIKALVKSTPVSSTDDLLKETRLAPLINLAVGEDPLRVQKKLISDLRQRNDVLANYLYIHSPKDFYLYLSPLCLEKGELKELDRQGPLAAILRNGGSIIVNWSNFNATEIGNFKSILDAEPTLLGVSLSPNVKVFNLLTPTTESCTAFSSRCKPHHLLPEFFSGAAPAKKQELEVKTEPLIIDLFHSKNWRAILFGNIAFSGNRMDLTGGAIFRCIQENRPLVLCCLPDDPELHRIIEQIKFERRFFFNSQFIPISPSSQFDIQIDAALVPEYKANFRIALEEKDEKSVPAERLIHIGPHNWDECFTGSHVNNENKQKTDVPGLLAKSQPNDVFYITEAIPKSLWRKMEAEMSKITPPRQFKFKLGNGATLDTVKSKIENKKWTEARKFDASASKVSDSVMLTNDTDFLREQLKKQHHDPLVIPVTPSTEFSSLLAKVYRVPQEKDKSKVDFSYEEQELLRALKAGRTVILQGEVSESVYQQLSSLLGHPPRLYANGEFPEICGKLLLVMPSQAAENLPLSKYAECTYQEKDYVDAFEKKHQQEHVQQIQRWYRLANRLSARETLFTLAFDDVKRMVATLQEAKQVVDEKGKIHSHNPLKGLLARFPKQSEAYAYLNVLGKYLFRSDDTSPPRIEKLRNLLAELHVTEENLPDHVFRLLNCFNGRDLHGILDENLENNFDPASPKLTATQQAKVWRHVQHIISAAKKEEDKKETHVEKRKRYLRLALQANDRVCMEGKQSGVGELQTVREVSRELKMTCYEGQDQLNTWLKATDPSVLVMYSGEQLPDGFRSPSPQHKIVFLHSAPDTSLHAPSRQYMQTVFFKMPEEDHLLREVLQKNLPEGQPNECKQLLDVFRLVQAVNSTDTYPISYLENASQRFRLLLQKHDTREARTEKLFQACLIEFASTIHDDVKRNQFVTALRGLLHPVQKEEKETMIKVSDTLAIPTEHDYIHKAILQVLRLRELALADAKHTGNFKRGILLEGDPGLGKSTLLISMLRSLRKEFTVIQGGDKTAYKRLLEAFNTGTLVVLEEFNLMDKPTQNLVHSLLNRAHEKPGFMILASQNSSMTKGRSATPAWAKELLQFVYMHPYSHKALTSIAAHHKKPYPDRYADAFRKVESENKGATTRTYYTSLKTEPARPAK